MYILSSVGMIWLWRCTVSVSPLRPSSIGITPGCRVTTYERRRSIHNWLFTFGEWGWSVGRERRRIREERWGREITDLIWNREISFRTWRGLAPIIIGHTYSYVGPVSAICFRHVNVCITDYRKWITGNGREDTALRFHNV